MEEGKKSHWEQLLNIPDPQGWRWGTSEDPRTRSVEGTGIWSEILSLLPSLGQTALSIGVRFGQTTGPSHPHSTLQVTHVTHQAS